jgi:hypothetical protein
VAAPPLQSRMPPLPPDFVKSIDKTGTSHEIDTIGLLKAAIKLDDLRLIKAPGYQLSSALVLGEDRRYRQSSARQCGSCSVGSTP